MRLPDGLRLLSLGHEFAIPHGTVAGARRRSAVVVAGVVVLAGLTACTGGPPEPDGAAEDLAAALETGDLSGAPLSEADRADAGTDVEEALAAIADAPRDVEAAVGEVDEEGENPVAPVELTWTVDITEPALTWTTTAELTYDDESESWTAPWSRAVLLPDAGEEDVLEVARTPADRGRVLGAGGTEIVVEREVLRLGVDKANLPPEDVAAAATALAETLGLDDPQAYADRAVAAGPRAFVEAITVRRYDHGGIDVETARRLPGVLAVEDALPLAPTAGFARPVLGTVGPATAEIVEDSGGDILPGDVVGLSGLQRQYDDTLRGRPGTTVHVRAADGSTRELLTTEPSAGSDVVTTLDPRLQLTAEETLAAEPSPAALVALRPSTGEVLAVASGPGSEGFSTATLGAYPPGSTFKVATALALMRAGTGPDDPLDCTPTVVVDGREFPNYPDFPASALGPTTLTGAIAASCNTALIGARDRVSAPDVADAAASLGVGVPADLGVPFVEGEAPADASGTEHAAALIGQGRVTASPLTMATVAASVAAGHRVSPVLVTEPADGGDGVDGEGTTEGADGTADAASAEPAPLTEAEAQALRTMMREVVVSGTATDLADVPGEVHAKTGTAEFGETGATREHAWTIAFRGDLAVAVFVEEGVSGADTAVPLVEQFLRAVG